MRIEWPFWIALALGPSPAAQTGAGAHLEGLDLSSDVEYGPLKWGLKLAQAEVDPEKGEVFRLAGVTELEKWSHVGRLFTQVPAGHRFEFRVLARGTSAAQKVSINAFALKEDGQALKSWSEASDLSSEEWRGIERSFVLPAGSTGLSVWVINESKHAALATDPHLFLREPAVAPLENLASPGVLRASASTVVRAEDPATPGRVWFPIPLLTDAQVPLTFDVEVDPPEALEGQRWIQRDDGLNWLLEVDVAPRDTVTRVRWTSLVLVDARVDMPLPAADWDAWLDPPPEARPWLRPTACVQSDDEGIQEKAGALADAADTGLVFVESVIAFTSSNRGTGAPFTTLDARAALACGGSCTSRANLCAALLRAGGVPARTSAHLPTWSGPLYEHWHVEYWHPGVGWTWVEPTLGRMRPQPYSMVVINVANPADEDQGFDAAIGHSGVMRGVPRHAVHEHSPELLRPAGAALLAKRELNEAQAVAHLDGSPEERAALFVEARAAWKALARRCRAGEPADGLTGLLERALAGERRTAELRRVLGAR